MHDRGDDVLGLEQLPRDQTGAHSGWLERLEFFDHLKDAADRDFPAGRHRSRLAPLATEGKVLGDPARVADRLAVDHENRDAALARQRLDLRAARAALGHDDLLDRDALLAQRSGDLAARAQPVGRGRATVEGRHALELLS